MVAVMVPTPDKTRLLKWSSILITGCALNNVPAMAPIVGPAGCTSIASFSAAACPTTTSAELGEVMVPLVKLS